MNQSNIGLFIQTLRKEKGLTQRELADRLGISDKAVSKWETARSMPDTSLLEPLCSELGISINELLIGEKLPPEDYAKKAEVTIMNLYTENQENRKITPGQTVLLIVGALLALLAAFFLLLSVAGMNSRFYMMFLERIFFGWVPERWKVSWKLRRRVRLRESSGERQVWIEEDTSVQLCSKSWCFWRFL